MRSARKSSGSITAISAGGRAKRTKLKMGIISGAMGTASLGFADLVERSIRGRAPIYAPAVLVHRLAARIGVRLDSGSADAIGTASRWIYGPLLGVANAFVERPSRSIIRRGLVLAGLIWSTEVLVLPLIGAAPRLRSWPRGQIATLGLHTAVFGLVAAAAERRLGARY